MRLFLKILKKYVFAVILEIPELSDMIHYLANIEIRVLPFFGHTYKINCHKAVQLTHFHKLC